MKLLPTVEDLKQLPLRASVALAARCAMRIQPLVNFMGQESRKLKSADLTCQAIELSTAFASGVKVKPKQALQCEEQIAKSIAATRKDETTEKVGLLAANCIYSIVNATNLSIQSVDAKDCEKIAAKAIQAVSVAIESAANSDSSVERATILDYVTLSRMHLGHFPMFGEPCDPSESGYLGSLCDNLVLERAQLNAEWERLDIAKVELDPLRDELEQTQFQIREQTEKLAEANRMIKEQQKELGHKRQELETEQEEFSAEKQQIQAASLDLRRIFESWAEGSITSSRETASEVAAEI